METPVKCPYCENRFIHENLHIIEQGPIINSMDYGTIKMSTYLTYKVRCCKKCRSRVNLFKKIPPIYDVGVCCVVLTIMRISHRIWRFMGFIRGNICSLIHNSLYYGIHNAFYSQFV